MSKETRSAFGSLERRAAEDDAPKGKRIEGYAAVFDTWASIGGWWDERIAEGAFKNTLERDDIRALFNHDSNFVIGRKSAGTLRLEEDTKGLFFSADPPDTQWARDLVTSISRGDISQCSFGFFVKRQEWDDSDPKNPKRTVLEVELLEVSPVTFPAFESTDVGVRGLQDYRTNMLQERSRAQAVRTRLHMDLGMRRRGIIGARQ